MAILAPHRVRVLDLLIAEYILHRTWLVIGRPFRHKSVLGFVCPRVLGMVAQFVASHAWVWLPCCCHVYDGAQEMLRMCSNSVGAARGLVGAVVGAVVNL